MADVSVCNRDKDGASAFIAVACNMPVYTVASTQAMLLLKQHHVLSNSFITPMLNSFFFPTDNLSPTSSTNDENLFLEEKSI